MTGKKAVSPIVSTVILTAIVISLGFIIWALSAGLSRQLVIDLSVDLDERVANVRSSLVIEYATYTPDNLFYICVYNNLETPLRVVDVIYLNVSRNPLNDLTPSLILELPPKSKNALCFKDTPPILIPNLVIVQVWAMPAHLFSPSAPFERLDKAVKAEREVTIP
ncbi:MAG: hypothetical protein NZ920_06185 [Aigarchaeota archaeon]|nr:hypothetical protein [Aigarchaeota archaeon]MDW8092695.1 archaellin/type IV pilin N-terminal domain-containing protein [Nitrososphaerota archaeon]